MTVPSVARGQLGSATIAAPLALLASLTLPLSGHGVSAGNRVALILAHLAVAGIVIPLYRAKSH